MNVPFDPSALSDLLTKAQAGLATDEEVRQLQALLLSNAENRRYYARHILVSVLLAEEFGAVSLNLTDSEALAAPTMGDSMILPAIKEEEGEGETDEVRPAAWPLANASPVPVGKKRTWRWAMAASVLLVAGLSAALLMHSRPAPVASLTQVIDATWDDGSSRAIPSQLRPGDQLSLKSGFCRLNFKDGTQVIAEGPAHFTIRSPSEVSLAEGNLTAKMAGGAWGFVIRTPTATVRDLGTEFGVRFDPNQNSTDVQVFQGNVRVSTNSPEGAKTVDLPAGGRADVVAQGKITVDPSGAQPQMFVRPSAETVTLLSVADLVCGGDGTTHRARRMVEATTGETGKFEAIGPHRGDRRYHPIGSISVLDGCFVPDKGDFQVDSAGDRFTFTRSGGATIHRIVAGGAIPDLERGKFTSSQLGDIDYSTPSHNLLYLHPDCGLTFNLDAIRRLHPFVPLDALRAVVGNSVVDDRVIVVRPELRILVNGALRFDRIFKSHDDVDHLNLPLGSDDHFLTLIATKNGDELGYQDVLFGDPSFVLTPK